MTRVLVTGATGFIGHHCLEPLKRLGYAVHAVTSRELPATNGAVTWHRTDLLDQSQIEGLIERVQPTHLLHSAWEVRPGRIYTSPDNFHWVQSSLELVEQFARFGGKRLVVVGTCFEYDQKYGLCSETLTPTEPNTIYGVTKNALRQMLEAFCAENALSMAWPRLFFLYGPHEHPKRLVPSVICALLEGQPAKCSHGRQLRDYIHVKDAADGIARLLKSEFEGPINLGAGTPIALRDVVQTIGRLLERPDLIHLGALPARSGEDPLVIADIKQMTDALSWTPKLELEGGLRQTIDWWTSRMASTPGEVACHAT